MADYLDGKIYPVGTAGVEGVGFSFARPDGVTDYSLVNAVVALRIWRLSGPIKFVDRTISEKTRALPPASISPALVLAIGSGLTID